MTAPLVEFGIEDGRTDHVLAANVGRYQLEVVSCEDAISQGPSQKQWFTTYLDREHPGCRRLDRNHESSIAFHF